MIQEKRYLGLSRGEGIITISLMLFISILAIVQTIRGREAPYKQFVERAKLIGQALDAFAKDHGGRYPDDGQNNHSPPGLSPTYIQWKEEWNIDYEVHDNGQGGKYVALEFLGPYRPNQVFNSLGLTREPNNRKIYGRGQSIPRKKNRIWVFFEKAPIYYPKPSFSKLKAESLKG
ncbi:MAG: hypothetical protein C0407_05695 [Desulfobacca sp.]|nr:hypothetical protein [Desulfobacca sp.]